MKKLFIIFVLFLNICAPATLFAQDTSASNADKNGFLNDETIDVLKTFQKASGLKSFSGQSHSDAIDKPGIDNITGLLYTIISIGKYVFGSVAVIFLISNIVNMISSEGAKSEEDYKNLKNSVTFLVIAVIIIISSDFMFQKVFVVGGQDFLASKTVAQTFANAASGEIKGIYSLVQTFLGTISVFMLVFAAFKMVTNAGNEEVVETAKKHLYYSVLGLLLVGVSEFVVKDVLFVDQGATVSLENAKLLLVKFTNFITGFMSTVAVLSFFYAGYLYIFSATGEDNTETVKKIIIGGIVGILIAAGAFALVNTAIKLETPETPEAVQQKLQDL